MTLSILDFAKLISKITEGIEGMQRQNEALQRQRNLMNCQHPMCVKVVTKFHCLPGTDQGPMMTVGAFCTEHSREHYLATDPIDLAVLPVNYQ